MIYKKSVVLSSVGGGKQKGVLNLEYDGGEMLGNVKLYNFDSEPDGILSVGILHDNKVIKAGLTHENAGSYSFKLSGGKEFNQFTCAIVNFVNGEAKPILLGATNGASTMEERLAGSFEIFESEPSVQNVENILDQNQVYLEDQDEIDCMIDSAVCGDKCSACKYRDAFFKQEDLIVEEEEEKEETFFDGIKEQVDTLFEKYPEEEILKEIIPNSKWVKIDYEEKGEYYVVGLMYENDQIKYVCYGVPSIYSDEPPKELQGFAQWLPIDTTKEKGFGYWITYQDADSGENVQLDFETV
ncbi:MAG: hypothetical protein E7378_00635 [Clostridiales bacterium]|nr:hypothetical protein [Clostridiales bacterium]